MRPGQAGIGCHRNAADARVGIAFGLYLSAQRGKRRGILRGAEKPVFQALRNVGKRGKIVRTHSPKLR